MLFLGVYEHSQRQTDKKQVSANFKALMPDIVNAVCEVCSLVYRTKGLSISQLKTKNKKQKNPDTREFNNILKQNS